ncbi:hypothetical protein [Pedobacter alluvionis]|uniref:DUF4369 domain-containing protein n=1 Tax=Pedobacter alluvionis TaxID=475253 RepID=A0A497YAZ5_9SPHI|nr:hypothetical protein [Pedobacter alluvionis]RLJ77399.1 hypothetical protein BCL90_2486 [Pedobacter alluvionis]TFB33383.1 hypothetical protein E3V97_04880 [Pedobacter alluvionis]
MRKLIFCFVLLFVGSLQAQTIKFTVEGLVQKPKNAKFVYLVSETLVVGKPDLFLVMPMEGNQFKIPATCNLEGGLLRKGFIFLDERGDITLNDVKSKIKQKVWFVGASANLKSIYLEDVKLDIENPYNLQSAKIIGGGIYLQQSKDATQALRDKKFLSFIKKNADSPVALSELDNFILFANIPGFIKDFDFSSPMQLYGALSSRLKNSKEGKAVKKKIDEGKK